METNKSLKELSTFKSERTTFNLSDEAYEILEQFAEKYKITQKEIFSIILDDETLLDHVRKKIRNQEIEFSSEKTQKTKVISKGALDKLKVLSAYSEDFSRDLILEVALRGLNSQLMNQIERQKKAKELIDKEINRLKEIDKKLRDLLDENNPIIGTWYDYVWGSASELSQDIERNLKNGVPIEPGDHL